MPVAGQADTFHILVKNSLLSWQPFVLADIETGKQLGTETCVEAD